jgi:uncharacterized membrane protein YebE (DUF533 family)
MIDADKILDALRRDPGATLRELSGKALNAGEAMAERLRTDPNARNIAIAGVGGVFAGILAGKAAPKFTGAVAKLGGLAALGGLAYAAWRQYESRQKGHAAPATDAIDAPPTGFLPPADSMEGQRVARLILRSMINAAKADGLIDSEEKARLFDRLGQVSLSADEQAFLFETLAAPMETEALVAEVKSPAVATQVYAAALMAIDADTAVEQTYLEDLARRLGLPPALAADIRAAA